MLGAAVTFNLGRDISILVLWPVIFAYFFVRIAEMWATRRSGQPAQMITAVAANAGTMQAVAGRLSQ